MINFDNLYHKNLLKKTKDTENINILKYNNMKYVFFLQL